INVRQAKDAPAAHPTIDRFDRPRQGRPMTSALNPQERLDWLRLIRSENVGPISFYQLLQRYGSAAGALAALPELAARGGRRNFRVAPRAEAERELASVLRAGAR